MLAHMISINWQLYPLVSREQTAKDWITIIQNSGYAKNTVKSYASTLNKCLVYYSQINLDHRKIKILEALKYLRHLSEEGLATSTIKHQKAILSGYYEHLVDEDIISKNPFRSRKNTASFTCKLPWIPNDEEWQQILEQFQNEPLRNQLMLAFAYDGALRREEVCGIAIQDISPGDQLLTVRPEVSKSHYPRVVPYSDATQALLKRYLKQRRQLSRKPGALFLSESRRNKAQPISIWTWSKVIKRIAEAIELQEFTTHTMRHLRLTDLARDGHSLHFIAEFAGHRSIETTRLYIHLSGREVAKAVQRGMNSIHARRTQLIESLLNQQ